MINNTITMVKMPKSDTNMSVSVSDENCGAIGSLWLRTGSNGRVGALVDSTDRVGVLVDSTDRVGVIADSTDRM